MSITIRKTPCPDVTLNINSTPEGTFAAGSTIDVQLTDGTNPVTPDSVTVVGNVVTVQVPACPPAVTRSTATLMKTGQTTSYRTGDDGDLEVGRDTDFLTLDSAPVHNDGSATLNTTTNRFTDTLGGSTYADDIVLDWSTWNGSTLLGWYRIPATAGTHTWNNAIDNALTTSIGTFTTGWRLPNVIEAASICDFNVVNVLNYAPFNLNLSSTNQWLWTSTTNPNSTGTAQTLITSQGGNLSRIAKTTAQSYIPCRTFTLSTSNILS